MDNSISPDGFRPMIQISVNKDGKKKLDAAPVGKDVLISLLKDVLELIEATPDNVTKVPRGLSAAGLRNWMNRRKKKVKPVGAFGS